jgi:hypothetical protein
VVSTSEVGGSYIRILRSDSAVFGGRQFVTLIFGEERREQPHLGASGPAPMKSGMRKGSSAKSGITRARNAWAMSSAPNHTSRNQPWTRRKFAA